MRAKGIVAAGHPQTARAAASILRAGGNAFDAALAAQLAACVVEPVFTSLGGGGFLLARRANGEARLYDFFVQTPLKKRPTRALDFYPIHADFGPATQEFHIGMGSIATPGMVKGLFEVHADLCTLPMIRLIEPALRLARRGVRLNELQAFSFRVLTPILTANREVFALYRHESGKRLLHEGELHRQPTLADTLEALAREGERLFYRGEIAERIVRDARAFGGSLGAEDLARYRVRRRRPLALRYRGHRLLTNPPPSCGGALIAFALKLLEPFDLPTLAFGSAAYLELLTRAMEATQEARTRARAWTARRLLGARLLTRYRAALVAPPSARGTTQISVIDTRGNMASLTTSNGEGSAYVVPGSGVMLNNMLGEEDINPHGFHRGAPGRRLSSMLAPTLVFAPDGARLALGSGGSKRIRTAMLQVLLNRLAFGTSIRTAVARPRIHMEDGQLDIEAGFRPQALARLAERVPRCKLWAEPSLFFGGVHACEVRGKRFTGAGDSRRGGVCIVVEGATR